MAFKNIRSTSVNAKMSRISLLIIIVGLVITIAVCLFGLFRKNMFEGLPQTIPVKIIRAQKTSGGEEWKWNVVAKDINNIGTSNTLGCFTSQFAIQINPVDGTRKNQLINANATDGLTLKLKLEDLPFTLYYYNTGSPSDVSCSVDNKTTKTTTQPLITNLNTKNVNIVYIDMGANITVSQGILNASA